ncbi:adducin-related protein C1289.14-like [Homarus americanus]|uniref:Adducin-related protein n=1 Tax=Homarus americanus TaxID=6706 RepID=A0A8J5MZ41_HOMAM|nr:adducin-related protein C1289.14-like [Homarus americanus]KAG7168679.1 Adducin-related protein [Homarus americanus]
MWTRAAIRQGRSLGRSFASVYPRPYTVPEGPWGTNRAMRLELAAAYRGLDLLGLNEGVCNHLTVMAPRADGQEDTMLVVNYKLHWSEVTASNLLGVDESAQTVEGEGTADITASCIHLGIRLVRPDAKVIMHTHQPHATAIACMKDPTLLMVHQNSARFYQRVAYDQDYSGLALAIAEGKRLGQALGDKDILFMGNHGVLSVAPTVSLAFDHLYYLERAAQLQTLVVSMQKEIALIPDSECRNTSDSLWKDINKYAEAHFFSMYRRLRRSQPEFEG